MKLISIWRKAISVFPGMASIELPYGGEDHYIADHLRRFHDDIERFCYAEAPLFWRQKGVSRVAFRRLFLGNKKKLRALRRLVHEVNQALWVPCEMREAA